MNHKYIDSETEKNLKSAIADEAEAHVRYMTYANEAKKQGYGAIAKDFETAAAQENSHAVKWMTELDQVGAVNENLETAIRGETADVESYEKFADKADEEGYPGLAAEFRAAGMAEERHKTMFQKLHDDLTTDGLNVGNPHTKWVCRNCGYPSTGEMPPSYCPLCGYPEGWFEKE